MATAEFGKAVRRWRDRVAPEAAGLSTGGQRRAPGLRREELAMLAGISVDYVTRLEQGRASNPSTQVVEALARALRLSSVERTHLFRLAGLALPDPDTVPTYVTASVQRVLDRLTGTPVAVYDAAWTLLQFNQPYAALMGEPPARNDPNRNGAWRHFAGPGIPTRRTPEATLAHEISLVSDLRTAAAQYPADQRLRKLITDLRANSPRFTELWDSGAVGRREAAQKTIDHPRVGPLTMDCDVLTVAGSDLRIMIYTAEPGTEDAERLALLTVLGTQSLTG
ncbi:helix-turn-helix domain-containing protein [Nocardia colli]|uniref:Helix-turn-helix domain-containing protein n=1 Tax=Nocardia colli TaxID=2545717 RepID=A0A5N0E0T1_9NOCA|nr:helix-turn-helix transcriptional regulator [Nocardia colli]KAA8883018.1 helix-turn-helix domain-containing protein [Nocardia colli]